MNCNFKGIYAANIVPLKADKSIDTENLIGNMMLACHAIPRLKSSRVARVWLGLEAETDDAMPISREIPALKNAYVIGSIHSGYTSGPYMGKLLAEKFLGKDVDLSLFDIKRFL